MQEAFVALATTHRDALTTLYAQALTAEEKRAGKQAVQDAMRAEYAQLRETWDYNGYDRWFAGPLNNAQLATVASYNVLVPFFVDMLAAVDGDLARFYLEVEAIMKLPAAERERLLPR